MSKLPNERRDDDDTKPDPDSNAGLWLMAGFALLLVLVSVFGYLTRP